jgi:rod shape determining protein RodA
VNLHLFYRRWRSRIGPPRVDVPLLVALLLLIAAGLAVLHSAAAEQPRLVWSQAARMGAGLLALWVISRIPPQTLRVWTPWLFAASLALLLLVPLFGTGRSGRHWLYLGLFYLQPSELLKLTVPLIVAAWLHARPLPPRWGSLAVCAALIGVPTALIAIQPDLGTALVVASSGAFVAFLGGMAWWRIGLLVSVAAAAAPLAWPFLREYHRKRFMTFLDPEADPLGAGWNIIQSKIAVGSGGLFGKGWGQGTQSRLEFLPEHTTDFIFAVLAEEFGLVGVLCVLALYLFIIGALPVDRRCTRATPTRACSAGAWADLFRLRAGQRRHGVRPAAGGRRADAAAQLRRHLGGDLAGGLRHRDERARASQADAPLRLAQMIDVMPCFRSAGLAPRRATLALQSAQELAHDAAVEVFAEVGVFDAPVDVGVVVDFDDDHAVTGHLLEVHAVEAVADLAGGAQRQLDHFAGRFADRQGLEAARLGHSLRLALGGVVVDLPVPARHEVLAGDRSPRG